MNLQFRDVHVVRTHRVSGEQVDIVWCLSGVDSDEIEMEAKVRCERLTDDSDFWQYQINQIGFAGQFDHLVDDLPF